ncbi:MAG TPA: NUDIX hydrolase [Chloroflexota bacterium]|nr:NUDIX hydrolase [Chloroflexota bacterium]
MPPASSQIVWQGDSWHLRVDTLPMPDGTAVTRGVVVHPGSVVLVPLRPSPAGPELLMLRQYRQTLGQTILELPAGSRHWHEAWLECAQRELREETGYRAATFTSLGEIWPAPGLTDEVMHIFLAQELTPDPLPGDVDENIEVTPMLLAEVAAMAQDGRLQDAKSVVAVWRTAVYLGQ